MRRVSPRRGLPRIRRPDPQKQIPFISFDSWITRFRELHEKAKSGALAPADLAEYQQSRRELGRLLLVAQQMGPGGGTLRAALRIAQLIKVELELGGSEPERTSTMDLASGGFAALLPASQPLGRSVAFTLHLPAFSGGGTQPVRGTSKVASSRELLDIALIDFVLRRFTLPA